MLGLGLVDRQEQKLECGAGGPWKGRRQVGGVPLNCFGACACYSYVPAINLRLAFVWLEGGDGDSVQVGHVANALLGREEPGTNVAAGDIALVNAGLSGMDRLPS